MDNEDGTTSIISDKTLAKKSSSAEPVTVVNNNSNNSAANNMGLQSVDNGPMLTQRRCGHRAAYMGYNLNVFQSQYARDNRQGEVPEQFVLRNKNKTCRSRTTYQRDVEANNSLDFAVKSDERIGGGDVTPSTLIIQEAELNSQLISHSTVRVTSSSVSTTSPPEIETMSVKCATSYVDSKPLGTVSDRSHQPDSVYETKVNLNSIHSINQNRYPLSAVSKEGDQERGIDANCTSVLQDAAQAVKKVPFADPEEVKSLLEDNGDKLRHFNTSPKSEKCYEKSSPSSESSSEEVATESDTILSSDDSRKCDEGDLVEQKLMKDVREIVKIFPNKDQYEIYAYLEAHVHKPDRVQIVVDELLGMLHSSQESSLRSSPIEVNHSVPPSICESSVKINVIQSLLSIFPRAESKDLESILKSYEQNTERNQNLVSDLLQISMFPKVQENLRSKLEDSFKKMQASERFLISAFLELFDNPEEYFYDESKPVSEAYKKHAIASLYDIFSDVSKERIDTVLRNHRFHYTPALRQLEYELSVLEQESQGRPKRMKINDKTPAVSMEPDEIFNKERLFTELEEEILEYKRGREESRVARIEEARIKNELLTCVCCYDDDLLLDDMGTCVDGHFVCKDCIRKEAEEKSGQGSGNVCCMSCNKPFLLATLEKVLKPSLFSLVLKYKKTFDQSFGQRTNADLSKSVNQHRHIFLFKSLDSREESENTKGQQMSEKCDVEPT